MTLRKTVVFPQNLLLSYDIIYKVEAYIVVCALCSKTKYFYKPIEK